MILRAVHLLVFAGFAAASIAATHPEWLQLASGLSRDFHPGDPPRWLSLLGSAVAAVGAALLVASFARKRSASLAVSIAILAGAAVALAGLAGATPQGRSWQGADRAIYEAGRALHLAMNNRLQTDAEVPRDLAAWRSAAAALPPSPVRERSFGRRAWEVVPLPSPGEPPRGAAPGSFGFWVSPDGVAFEIHPIGFLPDGGVGRLPGEQGEEIVFRGAFNPDLGPGIDP